MRVFLAGATGAIGRRLVPALRDAGYGVTGTTRDPGRAEAVRAAGADPVVLDPLDPEAVHAAVAAAKPDVVMHQLTALSRMSGFRNMDRDFATTNLLRTVAVDHLLEAAVGAGATRFIGQSFAGWPNARTGGPVADERHPLDLDPPAAARESLAAIRHLEATVTGREGIEGVVLRYGFFYGPGTSLGRDGSVTDLIRRGRFPVVGGGRGMWSFVHIDDAAAATVAAVEHGAPGIYHVTDDEPAPVAQWLPYLADAVGGRPPRRLPAWLARPLLGEQGIRMMTEIRGSSNAKAKAALGWAPTYRTWREGFRTGLGDLLLP